MCFQAFWTLPRHHGNTQSPDVQPFGSFLPCTYIRSKLLSSSCPGCISPLRIFRCKASRRSWRTATTFEDKTYVRTELYSTQGHTARRSYDIITNCTYRQGRTAQLRSCDPRPCYTHLIPPGGHRRENSDKPIKIHSNCARAQANLSICTSLLLESTY